MLVGLDGADQKRAVCGRATAGGQRHTGWRWNICPSRSTPRWPRFAAVAAVQAFKAYMPRLTRITFSPAFFKVCPMIVAKFLESLS